MFLPARLESADWETQRREGRKLFDAARDQLSQEFGARASVNDTVWRMLNDAVMQERNLEKLLYLYLKMGDLVASEGKDPQPYVKRAMAYRAEMNRAELESIGKHYKYVVVLTANDDYVCESCMALEEKRILISEALVEMPIPHCCTSPRGCRCFFSVDLDELESISEGN